MSLCILLTTVLRGGGGRQRQIHQTTSTHTHATCFPTSSPRRPMTSNKNLTQLWLRDCVLAWKNALGGSTLVGYTVCGLSKAGFLFAAFPGAWICPVILVISTSPGGWEELNFKGNFHLLAAFGGELWAGVRLGTSAYQGFYLDSSKMVALTWWRAVS